MAEHELKSWPEFFEAVLIGHKTFELRKNDRHFSVGDVIALREWEPTKNDYTGRTMRKRVNYVLHGVGTGGIEPLRGLSIGYVILGIVDA